MLISYNRLWLDRWWCGRGDLNPHGQSPTDFLTNYGFHRRPAKQGVWGLDYPFTVPWITQGLGAARLVSTPSAMLSRRSLARDRHFTGFPEFEQFYAARFRVGTQFGLSPLRLPFRHARIDQAGL